jgi:hypothetical protein
MENIAAVTIPVQHDRHIHVCEHRPEFSLPFSLALHTCFHEISSQHVVFVLYPEQQLLHFPFLLHFYLQSPFLKLPYFPSPKMLFPIHDGVRSPSLSPCPFSSLQVFPQVITHLFSCHSRSLYVFSSCSCVFFARSGLPFALLLSQFARLDETMSVTADVPALILWGLPRTRASGRLRPA